MCRAMKRALRVWLGGSFAKPTGVRADSHRLEPLGVFPTNDTGYG